MTASSREDTKFQYVMKMYAEIMRSLGWTGDDTFEVNVGGCCATGTATHPDAIVQSGLDLMEQLLIRKMPLSSLKTQIRTQLFLLKHHNFQRVNKNL
jgi:hypothetical protein